MSKKDKSKEKKHKKRKLTEEKQDAILRKDAIRDVPSLPDVVVDKRW
jgi:hypothetical protein